MRCKHCHYSLANLPGPPHRCPECGREFDPNDPATFSPDRYVCPRTLPVLQISAPLFGIFLALWLFEGITWDHPDARYAAVLITVTGGLTLALGAFHLAHFILWKRRVSRA